MNDYFNILNINSESFSDKLEEKEGMLVVRKKISFLVTLY